MAPTVLRYAAFTTDPNGGNPAGVVLDAADLDDEAMLAIAAEVGYAETAFLTNYSSEAGARGGHLAYFSPVARVPFCGHATIATAVALAARDGAGPFSFSTGIGDITLETDDRDGFVSATFTSVPPVVSAIDDGVLEELLSRLSLTRGDLDGDYPAHLAFAGNTHPVLVLQDATAFDSFTFEPAAMRELMDREGWEATVLIVRVLGPNEFEARNVFPVGAIAEDPATGAAAAAFGGYLRELELVQPPVELTVHQGRHVGRPSLIRVHVPVAGGIRVTGNAVPIRSVS
jgi:PhzF family phenazine biosynthesis protein